MESLKYINHIISILFVVCYSYQFIYVIAALVKRPKKFCDAPEKRYAVVISARNEAAVVGNLIESIKNQTYSEDMVDVFVVADNCTDRTAEVARSAGATVYERVNRRLVGKGYALEYLFDMIRQNHSDRGYEGYIVIDADNVLDEIYIAEMNKTFSAGYKIVTSYRNSKNYASNGVSSFCSAYFSNICFCVCMELDS